MVIHIASSVNQKVLLHKQLFYFGKTVTLTNLFFPPRSTNSMNQEKLAKLQAQVRIGGKVSVA